VWYGRAGHECVCEILCARGLTLARVCVESSPFGGLWGVANGHGGAGVGGAGSGGVHLAGPREGREGEAGQPRCEEEQGGREEQGGDGVAGGG